MVTLNGVTLVAGTDYEVVDQDIVNAGKYAVTIQGKGVYQGEATGTFVVEPKLLAPPKAVTGLVYNGSEQRGVPEGEEYTTSGYDVATDADTYYATVKVKDKINTCWDDCSTSCRVKWAIEPRSASELSITGLGSYVYNGKAHKPKPTVSWNGKKLSEDDEEYTVSYANNVKVGTATVTITCGEYGNFEGTKTATFKIVPAHDSPDDDTKPTKKPSDDKSSNTSNATKPSSTSSASKLPGTSDSTQPVVPMATAGAIALALATLRRRVCER